MPLLQLLCLLRVPLLHLLMVRIVQFLLVFLLLLFLQLLPFLVLLGDQFVLLLLVSLVGLGIAGVHWLRSRYRRKLANMARSAWLARCASLSSRLFRRASSLATPTDRCRRRPAMVH